MSVTIIYAIGGTGAKLLEALVHLCAAGLVKEELRLRLVDQDRDNGNSVRTAELIADYGAVRSWLLNDNPTDDVVRTGLFQARLHDGEAVLQIAARASGTLAGSYGLGAEGGALGEDDLLLHALFSDKECTDEMLNGFKGRPAVGSAVFLSPHVRQNGNSPFWATLTRDIQSARRGEVDGFLLLGSSFGGTGASGVPTIANYLHVALAEMRSPPRIGAVLMLRYFKLTGDSEYGPAALAQVRSAMEYYDHAMQTSPRALLDNLYLCGLESEIDVPAEGNGGGKGQANPALLPELVGALGAVHFLARPAGAPSVKVWITGHADEEAINWSDLPSVTAGDAERLCSFARMAFAYAYSLHAAPILSRIKDARDHPIYFRFLDASSLAKGHYDQPGAGMAAFARKFLQWIGAIHATAPQVKLGGFARLVRRAETGQLDPYRLDPDPAATDTAQDVLDSLTDIFGTFHVTALGAGLDEVMTHMTGDRLPRGSKRGMPGFIAALHRAAALPEMNLRGHA